jgi:DNA-binding NtrC family response regulator
MKGLRHYSWPGNIRELENLVERAYILERSGILRPESFPGELFASASGTAHMAMDTSLTLNEVRRRGIEDLERLYLQEQLAAHSGRINASAQAAGISTRQLRKLLAKYAIHKEEFK